MGTSLTAKLNRKRLQETLRRRKAARTVTYLLDHSVPSELRFHGILAENVRMSKPMVRIAAAHDLSPYIVHLNAHLPQPSDFLSSDHAVAAPNLLMPEKFLISLADAEKMNPVGDLVLRREEILAQTREDERPQGSRPKDDAISAIPSRPAAFVPTASSHPEPLRSQFVATPFAPPKAPENFAAYFEMPEADEADLAEEPDVISIDFAPAIAAITKETTIVTAVETAAETSTCPSPFEGEGNLVLTAGDETVVLNATVEEPIIVEAAEIDTSFAEAIEERQPEERVAWALPSFQFLPAQWPRAIGGFVLASFLFVLPLHAMHFVSNLKTTKSGLEDASQTALSQLRAGADAVLVRDASAASTSFDKAGSAFSRAKQSVNDLGAATSLLLSAIPATGKTYRTGTALIAAGQSLSSAGERIAQGVLAAQGELSPTPTSRLKILTTYVSSAQPELKNAAALVATVDPNDVPEAQRATFAQLADKLPKLVASVDEFLSFADMAGTILGGSGSKRYLVVFQNNTEIRATGGFMGSFAELQMDNGVMTKMDVPGGGTYDLQGSQKTNLIAPEPLALLNARWEFQDANWFPDFPATARQIMQFYGDAGGGTVDGVIAVNATYIQDFLGLLGPIDMPEYGRTIDSGNFLLETQKIVEIEYDRTENKPKAFIGDLAPKLIDRVMGGSSQDFFSVLDRVDAGLRSRDVQIYFTDGDLERKVRDLGWGGEMKQVAGDYLMLVDTNLGGGKTDGVISETAKVSVAIDENGGIIDTVTVTRTHNGSVTDEFSGVNNVDYVRLYVPQGATLLSAGGFTIPDPSLFAAAPSDWQLDDDLLYSMDSLSQDPVSKTAVYQEFGKTVFGNWVQTKPGTASTFTFSYRLPFSLETKVDDSLEATARRAIGMPTTDSYSFTLQKQSGVADRTTTVSIRVPSALKTAWASQDLTSATFGNAADAFIGALFEPME
ncbi:MAG: DUF4012 domain-containing protein [Candidatus Uhrbacteria bacterium]